MIPISVSFLVPLVLLIALFGSIALAIFYVLNRGNLTEGFRRHKVIYGTLIAIILTCDALVLFALYSKHQFSVEFERKAGVRETRAKFYLKHSHQYGEITLPKGTYIERRDPYDNGEDYRPFSLSGLQSAKFPYPLKIAGLWAIEYQRIAVIKLSKDQEVNGVLCKKNQLVRFHTPIGNTDNTKEPTNEADITFVPSQWKFYKCFERSD